MSLRMKNLKQSFGRQLFALFVTIGLLQLAHCEKIDIETYCTRVLQKLVCTGLDFGSPDVPVELEAKERFYELTVSFGYSNLTTIPKNVFEAFPATYYLDFDNCNIKALHKWNFLNGESAQTLSLRSNEIQKLSSGVFATMNDLNELNLQNNLLNEFDADSFKGLPRLTKLLLSRNKITHLPVGLFSPLAALKEIHLDDNHIEVINDDVFKFNAQLDSINFGKNKIKVFSKGIVRHLEHPYQLDLSHNPIEELNLINADRLTLSHTKLTTLRITNNVYGVVARHNPITEIVFTNTMNLQKLDLSYNQISNITNITGNGANIWYLNLSHNPIGHINVKSFSKLTSLRELYLSDTNIVGLDFGSFPYNGGPYGESMLNILDISYNNLKYFDLEILSYQTNLQALYVDGNQLSELNYGNLKEYFGNLNEIGIANNNWNCTFLKTMVTHLHRKSVEIRVDEVVENSNTIGGIECFDGETTTTLSNASI